MNNKDVNEKWKERQKIGNFFLVKKDLTWDFYTLKMRRITHEEFDKVEVRGDRVKVAKKKDGKVFEGLYSDKVQVLIPVKWRQIHLYRDWIECYETGCKRAIYTEDLKQVLPLKIWKNIMISCDGIIATSKNDREYLYDWSGNLILKSKKSISFLSDKFIKAKEANDKYALYDREGNALLLAEYSNIEVVSDSSGLRFLKVEKSDAENGLYNFNIEPIIPCENGCIIQYRDLLWEEKVRVERNEKQFLYTINKGVLEDVEEII